MVKRIVLTAVVLFMVGCGGSSTSSPSTPGATEAPATSPSVSVSPADTEPPSGTTPTGTGATGTAAPCDAAAMTGAVTEALGVGPARGTVEIGTCQKGFARVFYRPVEPNLETEQLFLVDVDGAWTVLTYRTGIDCADDDLRPAGLEDACIALGLRPASAGSGASLTIDELNALITSQAAASPLGTSTAFRCDPFHGGLATGAVLTCRPDPEPTDAQFPILTALVLDGGRGTVAWAQAGLDNPSLNADGFFSRSLPRGLNCTNLVADPTFVADLSDRLTPNLVYFAVVLYWFLEDRPTPRMDIDSNGIPCETLFPDDVVKLVWNGGYLS